MGKNANTSGRPDDPDLAPDAALAEDLGDEEERRKEQLAYYGGEEDDIDNWDPEGLDDGSDPNAVKEESDEEEEDDKASAEAGEEAGESEEVAEADGEESDEAGEGEQGETAEADEKPEPDKQAPQGIPKSRFDEVNERRKAAEAELAQLKAQQQAEEQAEKEEYDFDAAEMEYQDLLLDGKTDEALAKRKEIRAAEHATWKAETKTETQEEISQTEATRELASMTAEAEEMFPIFNKEHEDFNPVVTGKVVTYMRGYMADPNISSSDAFVQALADVIDQYNLDEKYGAAEQQEADPEPKPTGEKKTDPDKEKARKKAHTPVTKAGEGSADRGVATPSIADMSDADLDKLSEEQLARMRGDYL